tara:strand:- start:346 stop:564 length:219 start_codon:yes stop_codon:yes gene_type:complete
LVVKEPKSPKSPDYLFELQFVCLDTTMLVVRESARVPRITRTFNITFTFLLSLVATPKSQLANKIKELDLIH